MDEMDPKKSKRKSCSYRISPEVDAVLRDFVRRQRGQPLFLELGTFVEEAIEHHLAATRKQLAAAGIIDVTIPVAHRSLNRSACVCLPSTNGHNP